MLTAEKLKMFLTYEPDTGVFRWRDDLAVRSGRIMNGKIAGGKNWAGYVKIKVDGILYSAHRLAWLYVHGDWPPNNVDHIDNNKGNNAISNLRLATAAQNAANKKVSVRTVAPYRGVMPHGPGFVARVYFRGQRHYLGYFTTAEAARDAYIAKSKELHGDFSYVEPPKEEKDWRAPASYMGLGFAGMN